MLSHNQPIDRDNAAREASQRGIALFEQSQFSQALRAFESALDLRPEDIDLRYNLACAAWACGDLQRTRNGLRGILEQDPQFAKAHDAMARLLHASGEVDAAQTHSARAVELNPVEPEFALTRAVVLSTLGQNMGAWDAVAPALGATLTADRAAALCATLAPALNRESDAVAIVRNALGLPRQHPAFRRHLHFVAAKLFDALGNYEHAFEQAAIAHSILRKQYDPIDRHRDFELRRNHWTASRIAQITRATHGSTRPVFIIGMPRSGTSLIEQILACHPAIHGAGELDAMNRTAKSLDALGVPYPQSLEALTPAAANHVASVYLDFISRLNSSAQYVTDKMPLNFIYLDLIAVLFPQCHIIHCVRDPMDTCLSCYMTEFESAYDFAEELRDLGSFYGHYLRLMAHWRSVLPVRMMEVKYEDVVLDLESQVRRILEFLGLEWDPRCLRFHESARDVKTASRDQVRRPVYATSVGRWKHYEQQLAPLREVLAEMSRPETQHQTI